MRQLLLLPLLLVAVFSGAQTGVFTDERDGRQYKTIVIDGEKWFRENLRFQTSKSFCPNYNKDSSDCRDGNYYSNSELSTVCPKGWHVATIPEWENYMRVLLKNHLINNGELKYDSSDRLPNNGYAMQIDSAVLFNDTLLNLVATGWVEGLKLKRNQASSLWVIDTGGNDPKYHLHIGMKGFVKHSHEHHIFDKPRKIRKFPVRCVCETGSGE
ncbi:MAG: FISUMP domain-containing protein [Chitinophagaceae bacterium]